MFSSATRPTHRASGRAVIDYRGLAVPVGRSVGGVAVIGAVTATGTLYAGSPAEAAGSSAPAVSTGLAPAPATTTAPAPVTTTAPTQPSSYTSVKLRIGSRGDAVTYLQNLLNDKGAGIAVDGSFGPETLGAVRDAQAAGGTTVDGVVGPLTWAVLTENSSSSSSSSSGSSSESSNSRSTLRQGNRGEAVKDLQRHLNDRSAGLAVDGSFGPATARAVRALQANAGIAVDTVVGPHTWHALLNGGASAAVTGTPASNSGGSSSSDSSFPGDSIVSMARDQLGVSYRWGGADPRTGLDCSGLVRYVYSQHGISTPRTAKNQTFGGTIIPRSEAQPGDLVAFSAGNWGHIGIYAGNGVIIDASGSQGKVVQRSIWNSPHVFVTYR